MQDTNTTIDSLKALSNTLRSTGNGQLAQADAIDLAVSQLQGILKTQLATLTPEQIQVIPQVADLAQQVSDLTDQVVTLQSSDTAPTEVATPVDAPVIPDAVTPSEPLQADIMPA